MIVRKKIGILSMHRIPNYGSYLQAYALKRLISNVNNDEVYFIDVIPGISLPITNKKSRKDKIIEYIKRGDIIPLCKDFLFKLKLGSSIRQAWPVLGLDKKQPDLFDTVVIGSDEVFNCCQISNWGFSKQLFGEIPNAKNIITYAGSFGDTTSEDLIYYDIVDDIKKTIDKISVISVRDRNSEDIFKKLTSKPIFRHLDPVLIYGYKQEISDFSKSGLIAENYMIIYSYLGRINSQDEIKGILSFARSKGLKLVSIFCRYDWCDVAIIPENPFEVLKWFKFASYVVTDTFHGTIFSVITKTPFCTLIRKSNKQKLNSLLSDLNLTSRGSGDITLVLNEEIDFEEVDKILSLHRKDAISYLSKHI